jgi:hypothetical protein
MHTSMQIFRYPATGTENLIDLIKMLSLMFELLHAYRQTIF